MMTDLWNIIRKEWKEMMLQRGGKRGGLLNLAIVLGLMGVMFPLQTGSDWLTSPTSFVMWAWLPLFMVMGMVADSFAGERERHTLETLLASRLSDRAILFGKLLAAVLYGWGMAMAGMLVGAVTINVAFPQDGLRFYPLEYFGMAAGFSLLVSLLISALGVLVSLRSGTVRQAYQKMSIGMLVLWVLPLMVIQFLPQEVKTQLFSGLDALNPMAILPWVALGLLAADLALVLISMARFQRARLMLD